MEESCTTSYGISNCLQGFIHPRWCTISSIKSIIWIPHQLQCFGLQMVPSLVRVHNSFVRVQYRRTGLISILLEGNMRKGNQPLPMQIVSWFWMTFGCLSFLYCVTWFVCFHYGLSFTTFIAVDMTTWYEQMYLGTCLASDSKGELGI